MPASRSEARPPAPAPGAVLSALWPGAAWLGLAVVAAAMAFQDGLAALGAAWRMPEYSHGPLIPVVSAYLLLRHLRDVPPRPGPVTDRWPGVLVLVASLLLGLLGTVSGLGEIVAYAIIVWVWGMVLTGFGWQRGRHLWPPVLHLVFMLPLPGLIYYKATAALQLASSELGVFLIAALGIPVFLEGNVISLGGFELYVAEACSGLRYVFPVMSFTYVFAILYRGSAWHKGALLAAAVPIAVLMNAARIALIGVLVENGGTARAEAFMHLFEGWVVFALTIALMIGLSAAIEHLFGSGRSTVEALDLDTTGIAAQLLRIGEVRPTRALIGTSLALGIAGALAAAPPLAPAAEHGRVVREPFALFPRQLGPWRTVAVERLPAEAEATLAADDYLMVTLAAPGAAESVALFSAWYSDQTEGGIHSPEICIPGSGWDIAQIASAMAEIPVAGGELKTVSLNRAVVQKGLARQMVYYFFDQRGRRTGSDYAAKAHLMLDGLRAGRTDGALIRLTTVIGATETEAAAEARLREVLSAVMPRMPDFIETDWPAGPAWRSAEAPHGT